MGYDKRYWDKAASFYSELGLPWQWLKDGYIPAITELKKTLGTFQGKQLLDHGCGAGKISRLMKLAYGAEVQGIDPSENMLQEAIRKDPGGIYHLLRGNFPWPEETFDGVMSNWVFLDIGSTEEMETAANEIYRVLKSGGPFVMLLNNEAYIGKKTSTYQNGMKDVTYLPGDEILVQYFKNSDEVVEFKDYFWPTETYSSIMRSAGFEEVAYFIPRLNSAINKEIEFLQAKGVFPYVDYQALADETPTTLVVGKR